MTTTLPTFTFPGPGRPRTYNWDTWTDGQVYVAKRFEDFQCKPQAFALQVRNRAWERKLSAKVKVDGDVVTFQFVKRAAGAGRAKCRRTGST